METLMVFREVMYACSSVLLLMIAAMFIGRKIRTEYRRPTIMFGLWWGITGATMVVSIINDITISYGIYSFGIPVIYTTWPLLMFATFGLLYYTLFLFAGSEKKILPVAVLYAAVAISAMILIIMAHPTVITE
ncbi:MAG: hypothetical protein PHH26_09450, partial [Candidatus Thermoplasmatota archaeon]|nr:hypothetical protein [Candidatus Thermoplasmatota archaeon]